MTAATDPSPQSGPQRGRLARSRGHRSGGQSTRLTVGCETARVDQSGERGLPSGTVTFLFTDVEGSTRLWAADRRAMSASLAVHDAIVRSAIESAGGYVCSPRRGIPSRRRSAGPPTPWRLRSKPKWSLQGHRGQDRRCGYGWGCTLARPRNAAVTISGR